MSDYTIVPVTLGFDSQKVVGELKILTSELPPTAEFCFAIGAQVELADLGLKPGDVPATPFKGPYRLVQVALVSDANYAGYLKQVGVVA